MVRSTSEQTRVLDQWLRKAHPILKYIYADYYYRTLDVSMMDEGQMLLIRGIGTTFNEMVVNDAHLQQLPRLFW